MHKMATRHHHRANHSAFDLNNDFEKIRDAILETTQDVKGRARELISQSIEGLRQKSQDLHGNLTDYASSRPLRTIGAVLLGGMVLGFLMRRKRK